MPIEPEYAGRAGGWGIAQVVLQDELTERIIPAPHKALLWMRCPQCGKVFGRTKGSCWSYVRHYGEHVIAEAEAAMAEKGKP